MSGSLNHIEKESLLTQVRALPKQGHVGSVTTVTVSQDGQFLFTTGDDNTAKRWIVPTGQVINHYVGHSDSVWCLALSSCETFFITGSRDALAKRWEVESGECTADYKGHEGEDPGVRCLAIVPGDRTFFTGSRDFTMRHWDVDTQACLGIIRGHEGIIWNICVSPDANWLFSGSADNTVKMWKLGGGNKDQVNYDAPEAILDHGDFVWSVAVSPDSKKLYTGCRDNKARKWDIASRECEHVFEGHTDTVRWVAVNDDGTRLATAGYDVRVKEWDTETGLCLQDITAHQKAILCVTFSKQDGNVFSSSADALIMRFNGAPPAKIKNNDSPEEAGHKPVLVEAPLTTFTNIPGLKVGLVVLALLVQALQLASFAFSIHFPWPGIVAWVRGMLAFFSLSVSNLLSFLPSFPVSSFHVGVITWVYFCLALFFTDTFGLLQRLKSYLNSIGWGKVKKSRYKGDNPLEVGDRTATNKAEWQVWETVTWIYFFVDLASKFVWTLLWLASTLFAIPVIATLAGMLFTEPSDSPKFWTALVALILYVILFLRLRIVNGSASAVSLAKSSYAAKNKDRYIPGAWLFTVGGMAALDTLGPFTMADWGTELGTAAVQVGFSVVNSSTVRVIVVASLNFFFAFLLVANLIKNDAFYSLKSSRALFGLQAVQVWNSSIALTIVLLNDRSNIIPSVIWYAGLIPVFLSAMFAYTKFHYWKLRKSQAAVANGLQVSPSSLNDEKV